MSLGDIRVTLNPDSSQREALQTALRAIKGFLAMDFVPEFLAAEQSAQTILGQWLSLMPGRETEHWRDVEQLAQDLVLQMQMGAHRSLISDSLCLFLGGVMPTYTRAKVLAGMLADLRPAAEVEAYFHSMAYGSVQAFLEAQGPKAKPQAEGKLKALFDVVLQEQRRLTEVARRSEGILLAKASPAFAPPTTFDVPPVNEPVTPKTPPSLRVPLGGAGAGAAGELATGARLATLIALLPSIVVGSIFILVPSNIGTKDHEEEWFKKQAEQAAKEQQIAIALQQTVTQAVSQASNNECQPQIAENQKNGANCENDGYTLMEQVLKYQRLADPPKGKGLDGLFEKLSPLDQPNPMPTQVIVQGGSGPQLAPGLLIFIPEVPRPPHEAYDFTAKAKRRMYPKFVVFEAKHIDKTFDPGNTDEIQREARRRLGNTCDGVQMVVKWSQRRIPRALKKNSSLTTAQKAKKGAEIFSTRYARWIFVCLPGAIGSKQKLYVLIDVVESGLEQDINRVPAKQRKPRTPKSTSTSGNTKGNGF